MQKQVLFCVILALVCNAQRLSHRSNNGWTINSIGYNAGLGALSKMLGGQRQFKKRSLPLLQPIGALQDLNPSYQRMLGLLADEMNFIVLKKNSLEF